jgi:hypothetical protein
VSPRHDVRRARAVRRLADGYQVLDYDDVTKLLTRPHPWPEGRLDHQYGLMGTQ